MAIIDALTIVSQKKRAMTNIKDMYDLEWVQENHHHLVPCHIQMVEEDIRYEYRINNLESLEKIKVVTKLEKLRLLISVANLEKMVSKYYFTMEPKNLYYTKDTIIKIKERDILKGNTSLSFLNSYQSLIGFTFLDAYTYEDISNGGLSLLQKDEILREVMKCQNTQEILVILYNWLDKEEIYWQTMISIPKRNHRIHQVVTLVLSFLFVIVTGLIIYQHFFVIQQKNVVLQATKSFLDNRYIETIDILKNQDSAYLSREGKYILAISYIKSSNLKGEARENALSQIHLNGDEKYLLYWIHLGSKEFISACEIADQLNDERLLFYAYSVELEFLNIHNEGTIKEKNKRKEELEKLLDTYIFEIENQTNNQVEE